MWFVGCDIGGTPCHMHLSLQHGRTPLMVASGGGHVECVKLLLDRGVQVNHQDKVSMYSIAIRPVHALWSLTVRSLSTTQDGDTPLHVSRMNCIKALLSHPGIDVNIKNKGGLTVMKVHVSVLHAQYST